MTQSPIYAIQGNATYTLRPGLWVSIQAGYGEGGSRTIGGELRDDAQENSRIGATASIPLGRRHGLKVLFSSGVATRIGTDFDSFSVAYQYLWGL